jgi:hypothetical protein
MFISKDTKEFKWYWVDKKMHTVSIEFDGEKLDLDNLYKTASKLIQDKEELCKSISFLGLALTGSHDTAWAFLLGWLLRSIKKDQNWVVQHSEETISDEEVKKHIAEAFEEYAKMIRDGKLDDTTKSTPNIGGNDGTDLFKS